MVNPDLDNGISSTRNVKVMLPLYLERTCWTGCSFWSWGRLVGKTAQGTL